MSQIKNVSYHRTSTNMTCVNYPLAKGGRTAFPFQPVGRNATEMLSMAV